MTWFDRVRPSYGSSSGWASMAVFFSGYVSMAALAPILPAIVFAMFQPKRIKPQEIEAAFR